MHSLRHRASYIVNTSAKRGTRTFALRSHSTPAYSTETGRRHLTPAMRLSLIHGDFYELAASPSKLSTSALLWKGITKTVHGTATSILTLPARLVKKFCPQRPPSKF
eukprot:GABV01014393.1.p1 GENE.GABV01014393.1~~GABV01014393.1.p1  ORF type:complete len:107 (+),score=21.60 GABV01014393.1:21-341(+)